MSTIQPRTTEFAAANLYNNNPDIAEQKAIEHDVYVDEVVKEQTSPPAQITNKERDKLKELRSQTEHLEYSLERWTNASGNIQASSKSSTEDILELAKVVFDFGNSPVKLRDLKTKFKEKCGLTNASKYSQFHTIGALYTVLKSNADVIPTGWVALYEIAKYLFKGAVVAKTDDNRFTRVDEARARTLLADLLGVHEFPVVKITKNKTGEEVWDDIVQTATFDVLSNQLEVRRIIRSKSGVVPTTREKGRGPEVAGILCAVNLEEVTHEQLLALQFAIAKLRVRFPFFTGAAFSRTLEKQVKLNPKLAPAGPGVVVGDA